MHEYYLAVLLDRAEEKLAIIASTEGGMDIEEVADKTPEKIITVSIPGSGELPGYAARRVGFGLGLEPDQVKKLEKLLSGLFRLFVEKGLLAGRDQPARHDRRRRTLRTRLQAQLRRRCALPAP